VIFIMPDRSSSVKKNVLILFILVLLLAGLNHMLGAVFPSCFCGFLGYLFALSGGEFFGAGLAAFQASEPTKRDSGGVFFRQGLFRDKIY
jgi:hypothetical protein